MDDSHGGRMLVGAAVAVAVALVVFSPYHRAVAVAWVSERIWRSPR